LTIILNHMFDNSTGRQWPLFVRTKRMQGRVIRAWNTPRFQGIVNADAESRDARDNAVPTLECSAAGASLTICPIRATAN